MLIYGTLFQEKFVDNRANPNNLKCEVCSPGSFSDTLQELRCLGSVRCQRTSPHGDPYIYIYSVLVSTAVRNLASVTVTAAAAAAATTATTTTAAATAQNGKMVTVAAVAVTNTMITYDNDDDQTRERFWLDFCKQSK